ncbi:MAG TPA: cation transporter [Noviherbaspirillum sp.]|uniref:heavy-metal-associated domain-containing protein n=1 Tax=Noviherbaspirillum sp. TaxID=1926288 RepID=UPI002D751A35|nr:cation transporter [Noviherbaspirillum sp.]HYD94561.1 cation transporter [Noviherbaspirillum sp.]
MVKFENLVLAAAIEGAQDKVRAALESVPGIASVAAGADSRSVVVGYDDEATSLLELRAALRRAGIGFQRSGAHDEGMCCGSCG